ncbi:MAG: adenylyl-sulfate kinase, partial [Caldilineaceae bacterium]|nr:adenylyl-sulfate kinase [Caldilineaceae bacterium]
GITIDVAYRFFDTAKRKFIVADCPGHEQYTRNMATGASTADVAVVLVDARKGLLTQTRRHSYIVSLLGIREVIVAVNKMDLVGYDEAVFRGIADDYAELAARLGLASAQCIPLSALRGDNVMQASPAMAWYQGPHLLGALESIQPQRHRPDALRMAVQWVCRPNQDFRGFAGQVHAGTVSVGQQLAALPSGRSSRVSRIVCRGADVEQAGSGEPVVIALEDEIDVSRGDLLVDARHPVEVTDQFAAHVLWMTDAPLLPGRPYWLKLGNRTVGASVTEIKHQVDVNTQAELAAKHLELNGVGLCNLSLDAPLPFAPYRDDAQLGSFILIDRQTHATAGAGVVEFALRRAANIHWQHLDLDRRARAAAKHQQPRCVWFTGLSGSGKSTLANLLDKRLHARGQHTYVLDGDNVRHGLNGDLGFSDEDRQENIRRVAEVAKLAFDHGDLVICTFISPFQSDRDFARSLLPEGDFYEVFVKCDLEVCKRRDPKGLYQKALSGEIPQFTGISSPYEEPTQPELVVETDVRSAEEIVAQILEQLAKDGVIQLQFGG